MENVNTEKILKEYFDAQQTNFINHLQRQELNFQAHFQMLENLFSQNSKNDTNQIQQKLNSQKNVLENNMKKENSNFQNKLKAQKRKTNNLLARTNVYIPDNNNFSLQNRRNNINRNRSLNRNSPKKEIDRNLEFKKLKAISALPCFQYRYIVKYEKRNEKNCSICLNDFKSEDILIRFSCKEHIFHKSCLLTWLEKSNICPLCKKSLLLNK